MSAAVTALLIKGCGAIGCGADGGCVMGAVT